MQGYAFIYIVTSEYFYNHDFQNNEILNYKY